MESRRVALVTGAATGIGFAISERLLRDGFALAFATHTRGDDDRAACERLARLGPVHWVAGDLSDPEVPAELVREALAVLGRLDGLVNNAGVTLAKPALESTAEDFDLVFAVDVRAPFLLARAAAGALSEAAGVIVNVTSVHEHVPRRELVLYSAAKAALGMLTKGLALELAPRGVRVVSVAPGVIATERNEEADEVAGLVPLGRAGTPAEVAALVSFLCSDEAAYATGASFLLDGGMAHDPAADPARG